MIRAVAAAPLLLLAQRLRRLLAAGSAAGAIGGGLAMANQVAGTVDTTIQVACAEYEKGRAVANAVIATGLLPSDVGGKVSAIEAYGRRRLRQNRLRRRAVDRDLARHAGRPDRHADQRAATSAGAILAVLHDVAPRRSRLIASAMPAIVRESQKRGADASPGGNGACHRIDRRRLRRRWLARLESQARTRRRTRPT